jgi:hypothetical protein
MPSHPPERSIRDGQRWDLEELERLDILGFAEAWIGEHFTAMWEPCPAPDLLIAQALQRTERICLDPLGHLLPYHHPVELAHRAAYLDHLAEGRYRLGVGVSALPSDHELFGLDARDGLHRQMTFESLHMMTKLWTHGPSDLKGAFWSLTPRSIAEPRKVGGVSMVTEAKLIDVAVSNKVPHFDPYGWLHWPGRPWMSYQFPSRLGETQEGGGAVSECFHAASRMAPGDRESWHAEWLAVADRNDRRGDAAEQAGHVLTAQNCWLRAVNYYRHAEFWLDGFDPRRLPTFEKMEACSKKCLGYLPMPGEAVEVPYEDGVSLCAYFVRAPFAVARQPVLICMGGLDSIKDEMWFMQARGAVQRGISVLMIDGP